MIRLAIDKENKVPLYLQLKDQIKYYISTGALGIEEQLPPVKILAKNLGINFQTVRKAYRELKNEGLIKIKHGEGTFISLTDSLGRKNGNLKKGATVQPSAGEQFAAELKNVFERFLRQGFELNEAKEIVTNLLETFERKSYAPIVVFTECNEFQIRETSALLSRELNLEVKPSLIADLKSKMPPLLEGGKPINVVTTGFHVNEVRATVGEFPVQIDVLITNLNPETRRQLETVGENGKYSFICRDKESAILYNDLLKAELGYKNINLTCCTLAERDKVQDILNSSDVVLVSPPVYEEVKKLAPPQKAVYNVFERVDPMSLKVIKDRILGNGG